MSIMNHPVAATFVRLRADYEAALAAERAYEAEHMPAGAVASDEAEAEAERLAGVRYEIEDRLMATPSPDAAGLAFKYLVARSGDREATHWDEMLEQEARLFAGPTPTPPLIVWQAALADYRAKQAALDESDEGDAATDRLVDIALEAMDHLVEHTPAPNAEALLCKMELSRKRWDGFSLPDEWLDAWMADVRRLMGGDGGQHPIRLAERNRLHLVLNSLPDGTPAEAAEPLYDALVAAEQWILDTPATAAGEAKAKLRLIATLWHEGSILDRERAAAIIAEIAEVLA